MTEKSISAVTGSVSNPVWGSPEPLKDKSGTTIIVWDAAPAFTDIDSDGDLDLFIGFCEGRVVFYRNIGNPNEPVWEFVTNAYNYVGVENNSVPAFFDDDKDGDLDMFVGSKDGQVYRFFNERIAPDPVFGPGNPVSDSTGTIIDVGTYSCPAFGDINDDGKADMLIGSGNGYVYYYRNDSSGSSAVWTSMGRLVDSIGNVILFAYSIPALADVDNDGRRELFIGGQEPEIRMYRNTGVSEPIWTYVGFLTDENGDKMDPGGPWSTYCPANTALSFADIDNDGDLDLFMGGRVGTIVQYENVGTITSPKWHFVTSTYRSISLTGEGKPCFVDIDFDGDSDLFVGDDFGRIHFYPETGGQIIHTYVNPGVYHPTLRITDQNGEILVSSETVTVLDPGSPTCKAIANPVIGRTPLTVSFYGTGFDPDGAIVTYEWDFDGDGSYDYTSPTGQASHVYERAGFYSATLKVTDDTGKTATDYVRVRVLAVLSTTRTEIFNPALGQNATITSAISGDTTATLRITDQNGNTIRILKKDESRAAGITYSDTWDGRSDSGKLVPDGVYYYLIDYEDCREKKTYDLRESAQYLELSPNRGCPESFDPYSDNGAEISYSLSKPCEVSMYLWRRDYSSGAECGVARIRTLLVRQPRGTGLQKEIWDGIDDRGVTVGHWSVGTGYPITLWAFTLADNAIIVTGNRLEISSVSAEPNYFCPAYNPYSDASRYTMVSFSLSMPATVDIQIINQDGIVVQKVRKPDLPAGTTSVLWNGKDFSGNLAKAGSYAISLVATDENGERSLYRHASVSLYY